MLKIRVPYKVKLGACIVATIAIPFLNACKKDPQVDPYEEQKNECAAKGGDNYWDDAQKLCISPIEDQIKELQAQEKKLADEVRGAFEPAKTVPTDITSFFNGKFISNELSIFDGGEAKNIADSSAVAKSTVGNLRIEFGEPLPANDETLSALYTKANSYLEVLAKLEELQK